MPYPFNFELEMSAYIAKFKQVSCYCRLTADEEAFILSRIPDDSVIRTPHVINHERVLMASHKISFLAKTHNQPLVLPYIFDPIYPEYPHVASDSESDIDLDLIDSGQPSLQTWLNKFTIGQYNKITEERSGADAVKFVMGLLDDSKYPGFFLLYDLLSDVVPIHILPDEKPRTIGSLLLNALKTTSMSGVENVILKVMETHPDIAHDMPVFEDKRKMKLVNIYGYDIFQTHIMNASNYIKQHSTELDTTKLALDRTPLFTPPTTIDVRPSRLWLNPAVTDFKLDSKPIKNLMFKLFCQSL